MFFFNFDCCWVTIFPNCNSTFRLRNEASPYLIESLENLYWVSQNPSSWNSWFRQTADIDASETTTWNPNGFGGYHGWSPIGNNSLSFNGYYNGNGHIINGLYINRPDMDYVGFIGKGNKPYPSVEYKLVARLGLLDVNITGNNLSARLLVTCSAAILK